MTQPNEYFPEDATNFGSFSSYAAKTTEQWEEELKIPEEQRWGNSNTGLLEMKSGISFAQDSANFANAILGSAMQSNVEDGVSVSASFAGAPAADLGANFTLASEFTGAGTFGPNGFGRAAWVVSGGLSRAHHYRHVTETTDDYQAIQFLMSKLPQAPVGVDPSPLMYLVGRVQEAVGSALPQSYVYARIGRLTLQVGCFAAGVQHVFDTISLDINPGQVWRLQCGTDDGTTADPVEFVVYRNGVEVWRGGDGGDSLYGADYRGVGLIAEARTRNFATSQSTPGELDVWAAADYRSA